METRTRQCSFFFSSIRISSLGLGDDDRRAGIMSTRVWPN